MSENTPPQLPNQSDIDDDEINLIELLETIWSGRWLIISLTGVMTVLAVVFALLQAPVYTATVTILPDTDPSGRGQLAQFAGLAAMAGVDIGGGSDIQLYPDIIKSESVLRDVISAKYETEKFDRPVTLIEFWEIEEDTAQEDFEAVFKILREDVVSVSVARDTRLVTLTVETEEPKLSSDIANRIADQLDEYMITKRRTRASEQRNWVERRLKEVEKDLEVSEEALRDFRERNIRIADSPRLMLEQQRFMREVEVNNALFVELKTQYESVRIQEIRDMPVVQILDYARIPVEKSGPRRKMIVMLAFVLGGFMSVGFVFVRNFINSSEENKSFFQRITTDVKKDFGFLSKNNNVHEAKEVTGDR